MQAVFERIRAQIIPIAGGLMTVAAVFYLAYESTRPAENWSVITVLLRVAVTWIAAAFGLWAVFRRRAVSGTIPEELYASSRGSCDWLLLLRIMAAGLVFVMHSGIVLVHDFTLGNTPGAWLFLSPAWLGMGIFFTLSGFLIGKTIFTGRYPMTGSGVTRLLIGRVQRLWPMMMLLFFGITVWQAPKVLASWSSMLQLTLLSNTQGSSPGTGAFWALGTEFHFYVIAPVLALIIMFAVRRISGTLVATILVLAGGLLTRYVLWHAYGADMKAWNPSVYTPVYANLDLFVLGILANCWLRDLRGRTARLVWLWPWVMGATYLIYARISYPVMVLGKTNPVWFVMVAPTIAAVGTAVVIVLFEGRAGTERATPRWLALAGASTYPFYLLHSSVLMGVQAAIPTAPYLWRWALAAVLTGIPSVVLVQHFQASILAKRWKLPSRVQPQTETQG